MLPSRLKLPSKAATGNRAVWTTFLVLRSTDPSWSPIQNTSWFGACAKLPPCAGLTTQRSAGFKGMDTSSTSSSGGVAGGAYSASPCVAETGRPHLSWVVNGSSVGEGAAVIDGDGTVDAGDEVPVGNALPTAPPPLHAVRAQNAARTAVAILRSTQHSPSGPAFAGRRRRRRCTSPSSRRTAHARLRRW